jgi:cation transport ATPase
MVHWTLLVIVLLGGIPLLWETGQQLLHKEFSVDVIAVLAIVGSLLLEEYLAGALIVLMLSGGEALEAYALHRARSSFHRGLRRVASRPRPGLENWVHDTRF